MHNYPEINIAGINLRYSRPSNVESHTTAFHRDYNGYYTIKLFIPLSSYKTPFLEYIPSTELISIGSNHYSPKHISQRNLPKRIKKLSRKYTSLDLSDMDLIPTNAIHRELPSLETRLTLIVTYLSHRDYGTSSPRSRQSDLKLRVCTKID